MKTIEIKCENAINLPFIDLHDLHILQDGDDYQKLRKSIEVKKKYDFSLQNIARCCRVLRFNKYGIKVTHNQQVGENVIKRSGNKNFVKVIVPLKGI